MKLPGYQGIYQNWMLRSSKKGFGECEVLEHERDDLHNLKTAFPRSPEKMELQALKFVKE